MKADRNKRLMDQVTLQDYERLHQETYALERRLAHHPAVSKHIASEILAALGEVAGNALDHSWRTGEDNNVRIQLWFTEQTITLTVEDHGPGIPETMRTIGTLALCEDDQHLMMLAARKHATSSGDPERGCGIPYALAATRSCGGTLQIASGRAVLELNTDGSVTTTSADSRRGTLARLELPLQASPEK